MITTGEPKIYAKKGSLADLYGHIKAKPHPGIKISLEELPITFKEWKKVDNLFKLKNSTIFKKFL